MKNPSGAPSCGDKLVGIMKQGSKTCVRQFVNLPPPLPGSHTREAQS
jgi:hypothetical protein